MRRQLKAPDSLLDLRAGHGRFGVGRAQQRPPLLRRLGRHLGRRAQRRPHVGPVRRAVPRLERRVRRLLGARLIGRDDARSEPHPSSPARIAPFPTPGLVDIILPPYKVYGPGVYTSYTSWSSRATSLSSSLSRVSSDIKSESASAAAASHSRSICSDAARQ